MKKPSIAELLLASGHSDFQLPHVLQASRTLYGDIGANLDERDWAAILATANPLAAAQKALSDQWQDAGYLLRNADHLIQQGYSSVAVEFTYRQMAERLDFTYDASWSAGTQYAWLGALSDQELAARVAAEAGAAAEVPRIAFEFTDTAANLDVSHAGTLSFSATLGSQSVNAGDVPLTPGATLREGFVTLTRDSGAAGTTNEYVVVGTNAAMNRNFNLETQIANRLIILGNDNDEVRAGSGNDTIYGGGGIDELYGNDGSDLIRGGSGEDTITGGGGNDELYGEAGADVFIIASATDHAANETILGGDQTDVIRFTSTAAETLTLTASVTVEEVRIAAADGTATGTSNENIDATNAVGSIALYGNAGANQLIGNSSANVIEGGAGNDTINGGGGADNMGGGTGADVFIIARATDHAANETILGGDQTDVIRFTSTAAETLTLTASVTVEGARIAAADGAATGTSNENIDATNAVGGIALYGNAGANQLIGNSSTNVIEGGAGDDTINGGGGADSLNGGQGADAFVFANAAALVAAATVIGGDGTDTITVTALITSSTDLRDAKISAVENLVLSGGSTSGVTLDIEMTHVTLGAAGIVRLTALGQDVTGSAGVDLVNTGTLTSFDGTTLALAGNTDVLDVSTNNSNLSGINAGAATTAETLIISNHANTTMTAAQHAGFTTITATGAAEAIRFSSASLSITANSAVESYVLSGSGANDITLTTDSQGVTTGTHASNQSVDTGTRTTISGTFVGNSTATDILDITTTATNISAATGLTAAANWNQINLASDVAATMTSTQHALLNAAVGSNAVTITSIATFVANAEVESYVLGGSGANDITLTTDSQGVTTATHASNQSVDTGTRTTISGTFVGNSTATDILDITTTATNISAATGLTAAANWNQINLASNVAATMTSAQHALLNAAVGSNAVTITDALTGAAALNAAVETYVLSAGANSVTSGATGQTMNAGALTDAQTLTLAGTHDVTVSLVAGDLTSTSTGKITVNATTGTNIITTGSGADTVNAGGGDDVINGGGGADSLDGGEGADAFAFANAAALTAAATVIGGGGADTITVTAQVAGNLNLATDAKIDAVENLVLTGGSTGSVTLDAAMTAVTLGAAGSVVLTAAGQDVTGSTGADIVNTGSLTSFANTVLALDAGTDELVVALNNANLSGINAGAATTAETLNISFRANTTMTAAQHAGFTTITATGTAGTAETITLTDALTGAAALNGAVETYVLSAGANSVTSGASGQLINANKLLDAQTLTLAGTHDVTVFLLASDLTSTSSGDITVYGAAGDYTNIITTGSGVDIINTGGGDDVISGGGGADFLDGGEGADVIDGGAGADWITLGDGADVLVLNQTATADTIIDYTVADDTIHLFKAVYTSLAAAVGAVDLGAEFATLADATALGGGSVAASTNANDFIFLRDTGALYYNADGATAGGLVLVGTFQGGALLVGTEFTVIA